MKFSDVLLTELASNPREQQRQAIRLFPTAAKSSNFKLWVPRNGEYWTGKRLVIGIATYVPAELILLDEINEKIKGKATSISIEVFNFLDCANQNDIEMRIPGIARVYQTPIVALWEDGQVNCAEQGAKARELLRQLFD